MQVDAPTTPATHPSSRRQRLAAVAKDIRPCQSHVGQPMHGFGHTKHVQLFRTVWFRHTRRFRSQTLASRGVISIKFVVYAFIYARS